MVHKYFSKKFKRKTKQTYSNAIWNKIMNIDSKNIYIWHHNVLFTSAIAIKHNIRYCEILFFNKYEKAFKRLLCLFSCSVI